ncbi:unnamed protein product [Effrenium voratum]|nr:unnamed protein product [Effrenium voratum]
MDENAPRRSWSSLVADPLHPMMVEMEMTKVQIRKNLKDQNGRALTSERLCKHYGACEKEWYVVHFGDYTSGGITAQRPRCELFSLQQAATSSKLPEAMNMIAQCDLLFYKDYVLFHMVDMTTRWTAAEVIPNRTADSILAAMDNCWIRFFGPPQTLMSDQEGALATDYAAEQMSRRGINLQLVAKEQHCGVVERHNELLRRQLHLIDTQAQNEGLPIGINTLIGEAIYAKNILFTVGNTTPHEAVFGRTPPLLQVMAHDAAAPLAERDAARIRQIAVSSMIQATAQQKLLIANRAKVRRSAELLELEIGDLVEIFRRPTTKDASGWVGPATVSDLSSLREGIVYVRWQGRQLLVRTQDVRRALVFAVFLAQPSNPVRLLRDAVEAQRGEALRLGWFKQGACWVSCEGNRRYAEVLNAGLYVAGVCLHLQGTVGFRFGHGANGLPATVYDDTLIVWWQCGDLRRWNHCFITGTKYISLERLTEQKQVAFVQYFMVDDEEVRQLRTQVDDTPHIGGPHEPQAPELVEVKDKDLVRKRKVRAIVDAQPAPDEPGEEEQAASQNAAESEEPDEPGSEPERGTAFVSAVPAVADFMEMPEVTNAGELQEAAELELIYGVLVYTTGNIRKLMSQMRKQDTALVLLSNDKPFAAIEREHNVLTREEALVNAEKCRESMVQELQRWIKHKSWCRTAKHGQKNILRSKWVLKWKAVENADKKIKARLVAQGFLDTQLTSNYAGTSTKWSQRILITVAVNRGWTLHSADVSEAFLRGLTFEELAEAGEDRREVALELPPGGETLLRMQPGYEDFNPEVEVLRLLRPGFGLKDAPRLWLLALRRALAEIGVTPTTIDPQTFVRHERGCLVLVLTVHVDDLKLCGEDKIVKIVIAKLEDRFESMKVEKGNFTHLGLKHETSADGMVTISQEHYIRELRLIPEEELKLQPKEQLVGPDYHKYYMSLLGGVAWTTQTRMDIIVYVSALQRKLQSPVVEDLLKLNRLVRYIKQNPLKLVYHKITGPLKLMAITDSAYRGEDQDHLAVRSGLIVLISAKGPVVGNNPIQILEYISKKQSRVCRSTFTAELYSALDMVGLGLNICMMVNEITNGVQSAAHMADKLECGKITEGLDVAIDADAVFRALAAKEVKTPTDAIMLIHALKFKEWLKTGQVKSLMWIDTRDMLADALNKGSIDRAALRTAAEEGIWKIEHAFKTHQDNIKQVLHARKFPLSELVLLASERSAGKSLKTAYGEKQVEAFSVERAQSCDFVLMAVSGGFSTEYSPQITANGKTVVIDNSSAFRYHDDVPLVVPEINKSAMEGKLLVANPNCTTAIAAMALWPLHQHFKLRKVIVSTYQAASGAGAAGMQELEEGTRQALQGEEHKNEVFAHPLPFNVIPHIDSFQSNGYTKEEMKVVWETQKIFGDKSLACSCTAVRIPTKRAHSEAITIETEEDIAPESAMKVLRGAPGVQVVDDPAQKLYPMPLTSTKKYDVEVGRIRSSLVFAPKGLDLFVSGDQLLRGAALNAVLIAEAKLR